MSAELQVVPYGNGWDVIYERARNAESHHPTREAAVVAATVQARRDGAILVTFDRDGNEIARHDYGTAHAAWIA
ncbi:DUF2188 domain-containing protein (plasmid) [Cupriavidus sp. KK10]|jgi:hypothetical protein|uniref:DUF2188 domain-containing protein n=1 Tax=Cupriavidus sp. KK10 TaxID=1478019 RepID=UPI001BA811AC|nr:DUF2188 domain-containing protein [Cupriavidus sp. KK10]QUN31650.1 DUF2188 domain-containing protein [Cupriavidus sp. KK10]